MTTTATEYKIQFEAGETISQEEARQQGMRGWTVVDCGNLGVHLIPIGDTHDHMDEDCACSPNNNDPEMPGVWVHNSFDGREAFEDGERQPS